MQACTLALLPHPAAKSLAVLSSLSKVKSTVPLAEYFIHFTQTIAGAINQLLREPEPPTVLMDLTDTEVSCGGSAMLELKVKGYPKPSVVWSRDGQVVSAGGRFRFLYEDEESIALIIKSIFKSPYTLATMGWFWNALKLASIFLRCQHGRRRSVHRQSQKRFGRSSDGRTSLHQR